MTYRQRIAVAVVAALILLAAAVVFAWPRRPSVSVRLETVRYADYVSTLPAFGTIERSDTRTIAASQPGYLDRFDVRPGQIVRRGELVATISNPQLLSAAESAHAMYLAAAARAASANGKSAADLESAQIAVDRARRNLAAGDDGSQESASEQRSIAAASLARAETEAREADRIANANRSLYAQKAISRDALDQSEARASEAHVALSRAEQHVADVAAGIARETPLLREQLRAAEDALILARSNAGDLAAARDEAAARYSDWTYARDRAAGLQIRAPFDGTVQTIASIPGDPTRPLRPGDPVEVGTVLLTIATSNAFSVRTTIDEQDVSSVSVGQRARVSGEDFGGRVLPGRVFAINAVAQKSDPANASRQVVTIVRLDGAPDYLRAGMSAEADIITSVERHVLVVDPAAIRFDAAGTAYVYAVRRGVAVKTPVTAGPMNETQAVVRSGLNDGDVVVADRTAVAAGAKVVALP